MPKALLTFFLVGVQLLPGMAAPSLSFCIESDGEVCLDLGAASCHCCADEAATGNENCGLNRAPGRELAGDFDSMHRGDDCDCEHLPFATGVATASSTAGPMKMSLGAPRGLDMPSEFFAALLTVAHRIARLETGAGFSLHSLTERSSVVLRC